MKKKLRSLCTVAVSRLVRFSSFLRKWWQGRGLLDTAGSIMLLSIVLNCWVAIRRDIREEAAYSRIAQLRANVANDLNNRSDDRTYREKHEPALGVAGGGVELRDVPLHLDMTHGGNP
jgi:hypothetical protein